MPCHSSPSVEARSNCYPLGSSAPSCFCGAGHCIHLVGTLGFVCLRPCLMTSLLLSLLGLSKNGWTFTRMVRASGKLNLHYVLLRGVQSLLLPFQLIGRSRFMVCLGPLFFLGSSRLLTLLNCMLLLTLSTGLLAPIFVSTCGPIVLVWLTV